MFTGLVETTGVLRRRAGKPVARAFVETALGPLELGESISVNGACLTVARIVAGGFECDMSSETLERTTLGELALGAGVHLERSTVVGGRLGGHIVLGHVDGVGRVSAREPRGDALRFEVTIPVELSRFVAEKGSIAFDGVSLTLNRVGSTGSNGLAVEVMLVPHTLRHTFLGELALGARVNVEVDVLARYVARQLDVDQSRWGTPPNPRAPQPDGGHDERLLDKLRAGGWA
jgi:riboflavin synthase